MVLTGSKNPDGKTTTVDNESIAALAAYLVLKDAHDKAATRCALLPNRSQSVGGR